MCNYVHGTDLFIKLFNFTFYDTYYKLIIIMFEYIHKGLLNLTDDKTTKLRLDSISYEFNVLMNDIFNN